ncbi:FHA domain-containing protein [Agreia pratensis]|uniref:FHA domain-containing protein n=1 Tax=Agreia pratensis TaxID=150121 RepID=UPI000A1CB983|nr:FHA domain-containing protein [Agreia pratensis]
MNSPHQNTGRVVYDAASSSGSQLALVVPGMVAVLGGGCSQTVLSRLWDEMSSDSVSFERVVQAVPSLGADAVTSFAVAALETDGMASAVLTVVARGASVVDVYTADAVPRRFSSQGLRPWHLSSFSNVTGLRFGASIDAVGPAEMMTISGAELPLVLGVASVDSVIWMLDEARAIVDTSARREGQEPRAATVAGDDPEITLERVPGRRVGRHGGMHASDTASPHQIRPSRVRIGTQAPFELHVPVYIGRRPRGPRQLAGDQVVLVEVPSPTREVSASHLHIEQRGREVIVTDLQSTNGTAVTLPGSPRIKLKPGDSIVLPPYSRVEIGDGNVIEILPGAD